MIIQSNDSDEDAPDDYGDFFVHPRRAIILSPPKNILIRTVIPVKNIFAIAAPVSLYNLVSTFSGILRTLMITSLSEDESKFAAYSVVGTSTVLLYSGQYIFNLMEGMISKECPDKNDFRKGRNVGGMLQSSWLIAAIFCVPSTLIMACLSTILRFIGQDAQVCDNVASMTRIFLFVVPMQLLLSVNSTFLTCTNSKKNLVLFSLHAAGVGLMVNFILAKFFLKDFILAATSIGFIAESVVSLITSSIYILFSDKYRPFMIKRLNIKNFVKQFKTISLSGMPIVLYAALSAMTEIVTLFMFGWLGANRLALAGVSVQLFYFTYPFVTAINRAACILVGRSFGVGDFSRIRRYGYISLALNMLITVMLTVFYLVIPKQITSIFIDPSQFAESTIRWVFALTAATQIATTIVGNSIANLEGILTVLRPSIMNFGISACTILPLAAFLGFVIKLNIIGITLGTAIGTTLTAINAFAWWFFSSRTSSLEKKYLKGLKDQLKEVGVANVRRESDALIELDIKYKKNLSFFSKLQKRTGSSAISSEVAVNSEIELGVL